MPRDPETAALTEALAAPFEAGVIKWKPQSVKNNRCLAVAFIDARIVEDRLDEVLGAENWQDSYETLNDGSVVCRLAVRFATEWVTKSDVGSLSEQPDAGDKLKAAFSDALKRAAVKFGVGRYIYRLPLSWVDFDPAKKQIVNPPQLPQWALPKGKPQPAPAKTQPADQDREKTLAEWRTRMNGCGTVEDLNKLKPLISKIAKPHRQECWEMIIALAAERDWLWNQEDLVFFQPEHHSGDPVPF